MRPTHRSEAQKNSRYRGAAPDLQQSPAGKVHLIQLLGIPGKNFANLKSSKKEHYPKMNPRRVGTCFTVPTALFRGFIAWTVGTVKHVLTLRVVCPIPSYMNLQ
jgi:hypothetical protein